MPNSSRLPELPDGVRHLIQLNSSMVSALSLHYAHNGTSAPVEISSLVPAMTRLYRRRLVTIDDIQLCIGQLQCSKHYSPPKCTRFKLLDFGRGRLCIEIDGLLSRGGIMDRQPDEEALKDVFEESLRSSWSLWAATQKQVKVAEEDSSDSETPRKRKRTQNSMTTRSQKRRKGAPKATGKHTATEAVPEDLYGPYPVTVFIKQMPRAAIVQSKSLDALTPSKRRGEELYTDLKYNGSRSPSNRVLSTPTKNIKNQTSPSPSPSASLRGSSLLDRIRAKQAAAEASPKKKLNKAELARKSALSRATEVLDIISLVAQEKRRGDSTASMSMSGLVQQVQQSVRTPIDESEVRCVVDTLADLAEEYVKIVESGSMRYVTVNHHSKPSSKLLEERISAAKALLV